MIMLKGSHKCSALNHLLCWCDPMRFDQPREHYFKHDDRNFPQESPQERGKGGRTHGMKNVKRKKVSA